MSDRSVYARNGLAEQEVGWVHARRTEYLEHADECHDAANGSLPDEKPAEPRPVAVCDRDDGQGDRGVGRVGEPTHSRRERPEERQPRIGAGNACQSESRKQQE
ncbi:MAG: hypothetical protein IPF53_14490 [Blastocatellia bacterium]|nr:hypothetical protein [Blastocatellia bacterium]